jgi:hypothetical protein
MEAPLTTDEDSSTAAELTSREFLLLDCGGLFGIDA